MVLKKNQEVEIDINGTSHDGSGVGRIDELVIFVQGCAQGDRVIAKIIAIKKSYVIGKLMKILKPSPLRIEVDCPVFFKCGGCAFRHIRYEEELKIKQQRVKDALLKIARIDLESEAIQGSLEENGYRNKAQYPVGIAGGELLIGFYANHSHRIINSNFCALQPVIFEKVVTAFREWIIKADISVYDEVTGTGLLRHLFIRQAQMTGEIMVCAVVNGSHLPQCDLLVELLLRAVPQTVSIVTNINRETTNVIMGDRCVTLWGKEHITDILCGKKFELSPLSFYQVNRAQAERLYEAAGEFAAFSGDELLLDLYCGIGTIGLCLSDKVKKVIGVEVVPQAVEDARRNAEINGIENAEFICADAEKAAEKFARDGLTPDVVIVDPPRKGLSLGTVQAVAKMTPRRIVYVSCDPATLARDLVAFDERGYRCTRIRPYDMFPRTAHVETVVLMSRVKE